MDKCIATFGVSGPLWMGIEATLYATWVLFQFSCHFPPRPLNTVESRLEHPIPYAHIFPRHPMKTMITRLMTWRRQNK